MEKLRRELIEIIVKDGKGSRNMVMSLAEEVLELRKGGEKEMDDNGGINITDKKSCAAAARHLVMGFKWDSHPAGMHFWQKVHAYLLDLGR